MEIWDLYNKNGEKTGETIQRGDELPANTFHLVVHFWLKNAKGEYLIQKRSDKVDNNKGIWATTGGSAIQGDDSLSAVVREVKEEIGLKLNNPEKLIKIRRYFRGKSIIDVWLLVEDLNLDQFAIGEEVSEITFKKAEEIRRMIADGIFYNYGTEYFARVFEV